MSIISIVEKWKAKGIHYANYEFSCGGDSMNETQLAFYDKKGNLVNLDEKADTDLVLYFEDEVYKNVDFYEASDGHYMGEFGNVRIELDEDSDEPNFYYGKTSTSEWQETETDEFYTEITEDEKKLLEDYVSSMGYNSWNGDIIVYKKDFILTDEIEKAIENLRQNLSNSVDNFIYEVDCEGEMQDDVEWNTTSQDEITLPIFEMEDNKLKLKLFVRYSYYAYKEDNEN